MGQHTRWISPNGKRWVETKEGYLEDDDDSQQFCPYSHKEVYKMGGGALKLYNPMEETENWLQSALLGLHWDSDTAVFAPRLAKELNRMGLKLIRIED